MKVATRKICDPLEEDAFRPILHHYDGPKFRLELSVPEVSCLLTYTNGDDTKKKINLCTNRNDDGYVDGCRRYRCSISSRRKFLPECDELTMYGEASPAYIYAPYVCICFLWIAEGNE